MREITLSTGAKVKVLPLKCKDVRELAAIPKSEDFAQVFGTLERAGFGQDFLDPLPFPDVLAMDRAVVAETFGSEEEEKN